MKARVRELRDEPSRAMPGMRRRTSKARQAVIAMAALASAFAVYYGGQYWLLVADGATTRALGIRVDRQALVGKNLVGGPYRYFADYAFLDGAGRRRTGRQSISRDLYTALAGGRYAPAIEVRYSKSLPAVNVLDMRGPRTLASVLGLLALLGWGAITAGYRR